MRIFYHQASLTKSWNGPVQLLLMGTSLMLQATPHWKKQMNYTFPNTINSGGLKSKVIFLPEEVGSDLPVTMWYFENSFGVVCKVPPRSSSHEGLCLLSPEEIYWLWIMCVQQDYISCLVLWSIQQFTRDWKWNAPAQAWVFIYWYRTLWWFFKYWPFDEEQTQSILSYKLYSIWH